MHTFQIPNAIIAIGAVVMETQIIRWVRGDEMHELLEPSLPILVIRHGRTYEFLPPVSSQRHHLIVPSQRGALGGDVVLVGFVEEMDDGLGGVEDVLPVAAGELGFEVDYGSEGSSGAEFGRGPGVPVADGGEGPVEVALVHGPWDAWVAGTGGVGPVPEETALFDYHCVCECDDVV